MRARNDKRVRRAVVLLSGGLDSATTLYCARKSGYKVSCLTFDYGQRHNREVSAARRIARAAGCACTVLKIRLPWKGSSLLDKRQVIPRATQSPGLSAESGMAAHADYAGYRVTGEIPSTYVPARNIIFLSYALSFAEAIKAKAVFIGANAVDYSGYPDCRPQFYRAFEKVVATGTKAGVQKQAIRVITPLLALTKAQIITLGTALGVPYAMTWSCYRGKKRACGVCESCRLRAKGFHEAKITDPALKKR